MPKGWTKIKLGDLICLNYGKGLREESRTKGNIPVYGSSGICGYHDEALVSDEGIIVGRKGTVGSVYKSKGPFFPIDTVYYIQKQETQCNWNYIYYLLKYLQLGRLNFDSAVPGLNRDIAYDEEVIMPKEEAEQEAIARVLTNFDDKSELLREENNTLETIIQTLFKQWFAGDNLDNTTGTWEVRNLSSIANFLNGVPSQKYPPKNKEDVLPVIKIRELKSGITNVTDQATKDIDNKYIVNDGDILFSWSGSLELVIWEHGRGVLNQHLFKVSSKDFPKWFFYSWIKKHLPHFRMIATSKATTMGHIQRHHLDEAKVLIPPDDLLRKADKNIGPLFGKLVNNKCQIHVLNHLQNILLPELMSGEMRVIK